MGFVGIVLAQDQSPSDVLPTSAGDLKITFVGHGSLMLTFNGEVIHVDPYGKLTDYSKLPTSAAPSPHCRAATTRAAGSGDPPDPVLRMPPLQLRDRCLDRDR
jgi:hypothetical protein